jgi:RNA polymerase sigma factor (sigma-70 family)
MAVSQMNRIIKRIRHISLAQNGGALTDAQLLELFIACQEEAAFEAIVRRHGSMVLSVCRRVLHNTQDAEDAFQATFLVLARKASTIRSRGLVANWLYGVAYQTALKARIAATKRLARERPMNEMPEPEAAQECLQDWQHALDQELNSLPEKYRVPIVLCDLEGKTRKEAAHQLGLPEGTLSSRLARARMLLAKRLVRHGVALSGGAVATILSQDAASACVPALLIGSTVKAATSIAAGKAVAVLVSAEVAALTEGMLKTMFLTKLKLAAVVLFVGAISVCGTLVAVRAVLGATHFKSFTGAAGKTTERHDDRGQLCIQPGGGPTDGTAEIKHIKEVAKLRTTDLRQRTQNVHALLRDVKNGKIAGRALQGKINELNNDLAELWFKMASFGIGGEPYLENIRVSDSGFGRASAPPDYGIPGPYAAWGLPRLHERFLVISGVKGKAAEKKNAEFMKLVQAYSNPAIYQHRDFNERAYNEYRQGEGLFTPQYEKDLKDLDQWLTDLDTVIQKQTAYFDK